MEIVKKRKSKIVWLCWFANEQMNFYFNKKVDGFAPWINNLIKIFETKDDVDLHIVSPNVYSNCNSSFHINNIHYHFFKQSDILPQRLNNKLHINDISNFYLIKRKIKKIIDQIEPDLIHLHGAENPIYSAGILPLLKKYKCFTTIQGFISLDLQANNPTNKRRKKIELNILKKNQNFGVRTKDMCNYISSINEHANFFWHHYPFTKPQIVEDTLAKKEFDCAFFGRVAPENGVDELLKTIAIVKATKKDISLIIVGPVGNTYLQYLESICSELNITDNVKFTGFMNDQQDAFKNVIKAKMDVLPTQYDIIPGSILECMYMGVPVISYSVGGIPELNKERQSVVLVEKGNIKGLAEEIIYMLKNPSFREKIISNAKITVGPFYNYEMIYKDILDIYDNLNL